MRKLIFVLIVSLCLGFLGVGCSSIGVQRVQTDTTIDLSGKWNDTDSRLVSEEMIQDVLSRPWHKKFMRNHEGKLPVVVVGAIRNRSHEHINTRTFVKDLEKALINSGEVDFVASQGIRKELRDEVKQQSSYSSEDTAKEAGEELGADFMLKGEINTIRDKIEGEEVMFYQVNLELIDIESHRKAWIGDKKIKKVIDQNHLGI